MYVGNDLQWHFNPNIQVLNKLAVYTHDWYGKEIIFHIQRRFMLLFTLLSQIHAFFYIVHRRISLDKSLLLWKCDPKEHPYTYMYLELE